MKRIVCLVLLAVAMWTGAALAANTVVVTSKSVELGATGVTIPILLENDVNLKSVICPLAFREQTPGAFVTSVALTFGDRLPVGGPLTEISFRNQYADENGTCKDGLAGGFGTISFSDGGPNPVVSSPEGVLFVRQKLFSSDLIPGADVTGSCILTVDVTSVDGTFEIDTTCANPSNHLFFGKIDNTAIIPEFTKAIITIGNPDSNAPPDALCQDVTVDADASCVASVTPAQVDNGSSDPDSDPITLALEPAGPYPLGPTPVLLIVTDDSGDADSCNATITVVDNTDPTITVCPGDVTVACTADIPSPNIGDVTATDNCGATISHEGDASDGLSCPETITRTYRATDAAGNFAVCEQIITVNDAEDPIITVCAPDISVQCEAEVPVPDIGLITATDNCASVTITWESDTPLSPDACGGTITRTYRAEDNCGNFAECTQIITVDDTTIPTLTCEGQADLTVDANCEVLLPDLSGSILTLDDNCSDPGNIIVTQLPAAGAVLNVGTTVVTLTAADECGNENTCDIDVVVADDTPPTISCPGNIAVQEDAPGAGAVVNFADATFDDNCPGAVLAQISGPPSGSTFLVGPTTTITFEVTDAAGLKNECSFTITVTEDIPPLIALCQDVTVAADANCEAAVDAAQVDDGSSGSNITMSLDPPGPYGLGPNSVELVVVDDQGGEERCPATITVEDNTPPTTTCPGDITVNVQPGPGGAVVEFAATVTDNCPDATVACVPPSGSFFPLGQTTVTCTGTDASGNIHECSFTVDVIEIFTNPPVASDDYKSTRGGTTLLVVGAGVLVNDYDLDGDPLTAVLDTDVSVGALTLNPDGSFSYLAPVDYVGPDQFTYYANDGLVNSTAPATVYINVKPDKLFLVGDFDQDGFITALDLGVEVDVLFRGQVNPFSLDCNASCADFNCDRFSDIIDLNLLIDHLYGGAAGPCDPCAD